MNKRSNPFNAGPRKSAEPKKKAAAKSRIRYNGGRRRKASSPKSIGEALSE